MPHEGDASEQFAANRKERSRANGSEGGRRFYISVGLWAQMALLHLKQIDLAMATATTRQYVAKRYADPRVTVSEDFARRASEAFGLPMDQYFLPAPGLAERRYRPRPEKVPGGTRELVA